MVDIYRTMDTPPPMEMGDGIPMGQALFVGDVATVQAQQASLALGVVVTFVQPSPGRLVSTWGSAPPVAQPQWKPILPTFVGEIVSVQ